MEAARLSKKIVDALLKKVQSGELTQSEGELLFKTLKQTAPGALYRRETQPSRLLKKGFSEEFQSQPVGKGPLAGISETGEVQGVFYSPRSDLDSMYTLITGAPPLEKIRYPKQYAPNVEALPLPGAKAKKYGARDWKTFENISSEVLTKELKKGADFVAFPDTVAGNPNKWQIVQLNPKKAIARIRTEKGDVYKLLGAGGIAAAALGGLAKPAEAAEEAKGAQGISLSNLDSQVAISNDEVASTISLESLEGEPSSEGLALDEATNISLPKIEEQPKKSYWEQLTHFEVKRKPPPPKALPVDIENFRKVPIADKLRSLGWDSLADITSIMENTWSIMGRAPFPNLANVTDAFTGKQLPKTINFVKHLLGKEELIDFNAYDWEAYRQARRPWRDTGLSGYDFIPLGKSIQHLEENIEDILDNNPIVNYAAWQTISSELIELPFWTAKGAQVMWEPIKLALRFPGMAYRKSAQLGSKIVPSFIADPLKKGTKWLQDGAWEVVSYPFTKRFIPSEGTKKSIAEIMQPATERMNLRQRNIFTKASVQKALTTELGQELGAAVDKLPTALGRWEVIKAVRGTPLEELTDEGAKAIVKQYQKDIKSLQLNPRYQSALEDRFAKLVQKEITAPEEVFYGEAPAQFLKEIDEGITEGGAKGLKQLRQGLIKAIEDPNVSEDFARLAKSIYNFPATSTELVAAAAKDAQEAFIKRQLLQLPGAVKIEKPIGAATGEYLESIWSPLKGKWVKRDIELQLRDIQEIPKIAHSSWNKWFMTPWKTSKVILRPATHFRNIMSNIMLNDLGGLSFTRGDIYMKALDQMIKKDPLWTKFARDMGTGGTFSVNEANQLAEGLKYGANMWDKGLSMFDKIAQQPRKLYGLEEQWFKYAKYIHNVEEKGMQHQEALYDAMKWTFNYGEVTRATAQARTYLMPFFTWQSKVFPIVAESVVKHPLRFGKWPLMGMYLHEKAIDAVGMNEEEWSWVKSVLPQYINDGQFAMIPFRDQQGRLQLLNMTYILPGWGDFVEWKNSPMKSVLANPLYSISSALLTNRGYAGQEIYHDWEPINVQAKKMFLYSWEQIIPSWGPGGTDFNAAMRTYFDSTSDRPEGERYQGQTPAQVILSNFGLKITPVDELVAAKKKESLRRMNEAEMKMQLKKRFREAHNDEEREEAINDYKDYVLNSREEARERGSSLSQDVIQSVEDFFLSD